ncbi:MAG: cupin-like domain-containing protein [Gammaproteobacteria bacterium]|nr:cupin-like domain-containing protein [Gammaproteobacteria bacterium]
MVDYENEVAVVDDCSGDAIPDSVLTSTRPLHLKGLIADWPAVSAGRETAVEAAKYIRQFDSGAPLTAYVGGPEIEGRIFYNEDFTGFNFERTRQSLEQVLNNLFSPSAQGGNTYYVGSTLIDHWLPGFREDNDLNLAGREHLASIWLGNQSRIAPHYDFPNNIACAVAGRRRFTLFPPDQAENLYVGPLEFTPSGQPISLVDVVNPDYQTHPKYRVAEAAALVVDLEPGDAVFIPSMWWHHVEALDAFNVLVNYWWRSTPAWQGSPLNALHHAILSLRELPPEQKQVWRDIFEYYVFSDDEHAFDHIPEQARGVLSGLDEVSAAALRAQLVKFLK